MRRYCVAPDDLLILICEKGKILSEMQDIKLEKHSMSENNESLNPNLLFDTMLIKLNLKNDLALALVLGAAPSVISKMRHLKIPVGATMLLRLHEVSEVSIKELRNLMGDRRARFNAANQQPYCRDRT